MYLTSISTEAQQLHPVKHLFVISASTVTHQRTIKKTGAVQVMRERTMF